MDLSKVLFTVKCPKCKEDTDVRMDSYLHPNVQTCKECGEFFVTCFWKDRGHLTREVIEVYELSIVGSHPARPKFYIDR